MMYVLSSICQSFLRCELIFLREYTQAMASLANVLNILQAETKIYRGYLLPVLSELRDQLILLRDLLSPNRHTDLRDQASQ